MKDCKNSRVALQHHPLLARQACELLDEALKKHRRAGCDEHPEFEFRDEFDGTACCHRGHRSKVEAWVGLSAGSWCA